MHEKLWPADSFSKYKTRDIPNKVCIVISTQFNFNCIFRIDLVHLQQKAYFIRDISCFICTQGISNFFLELWLLGTCAY